MASSSPPPPDASGAHAPSLSDAAAAAASPREVDVAFICDCTGSMGSYLAAAKESTTRIVREIVASEKADVRFALVTYRDHPPQDSTYVTRTFPFTDSRRAIQEAVDSMAADGGGDGPEAVTPALKAALDLDWRKNATKVAVLIADAPPHGIEPSGDGFPDGDPSGLDPLELAREMAANGITLYSCGCEPAIRHYRHCADFLIAIADITGGQAVTLSSASQLAALIVAGAREEVQLEALMRDVREELHQQARAEGVDVAAGLDEAAEERYAAAVSEKLRTRGVRTTQLHTDGHMQSRFAGMVKGSTSLAAAKCALAEAAGPAEHEVERGRVYAAAGGPPRAAMAAPARRRSGGVVGFLSSLLPSTSSAPAPAGPPMEVCAAAAEFEEAAPMPCVDGFSAAAAAAPPPPAPGSYGGLGRAMPASSATYVEAKEELVSEAQVRRMIKKSVVRKG